MRHCRTPFALLPIVLFVTACAPAGSTPVSTPTPDRVLVIDSDGQPVRTTAGDMARASFDAPLDRVWPALMLSYADLGIEPTVVDRAAGRYGNGSFTASRRMAGRPLGEFFSCGSGLTGPLIESGRLTANVVTTLQADPGGTTRATTYATGTLRRNDGTSTAPIVCPSTGALEEHLRRGIESRLAGRP